MYIFYFDYNIQNTYLNRHTYSEIFNTEKI